MKIKFNQARTFIAKTTVTVPTDTGTDEVIAEVKYRIPADDEKLPLTQAGQLDLVVVDITNLEEFADFNGAERGDVLAAVKKDVCFMPALLRGFVENTTGKNTR